MPALSLRTRLTAVVVLILFAAGMLITYANSVTTERMLFTNAKGSAQFMAAEFNLATNSGTVIDTTVLKADARLALRLLPETEFIGFFRWYNPDSLMMVASSGQLFSGEDTRLVIQRLTRKGIPSTSVASIKYGNSLYSYSVLQHGADVDWGYALTVVTLDRVHRTVIRSVTTGAIITLIVSVLSSLLLLLAMRLTFLRPFEDFAAAMRQAGSGRLDVRLSQASGTEFRNISRIFNEMMSELQKAGQQQRDYSISLQKEIDAATESIKSKNNEIMALHERLNLFESQAAVGKVASRLAHEIGSPLNAIYTSVQLLLENDLPKTDKAKLKVIERQVETMISIIDRSLQSKKMAMPSKQRIVVKDLVEDTRLVMEGKLREKSARLYVQMEDPQAVFQADLVQIQQVLINLLNNSVDAIRSSKDRTLDGEITLTIYKDDSYIKGGLRFDVTDDGEGVPPEIVGQLFIDYINSKKPNGNGLGLVICKEIIDRHGGKIFLSDSSERGSTFSMILPSGDER